MSFPLFRRPGGVIFLDDDPAYLEMLGLTMPDGWPVGLFLRPQTCVNFLQQEPPQWEADTWNQQQIIDRWRNGTALIPQILNYWNDYPGRYNLTKVFVVDYAMPGMNGMQVLGELVDWPGSRVLLTGQADEAMAVNAFNQSVIDQFLPKQSPNIARRLKDVTQALLDRPHPRHDQIWRNTLSPAQSALLRVPTVAQDLRNFALRRWVEHIVIGSPFGILGLDQNGAAGWLQLESQDGLEELATLAESEGVKADLVANLRTGKQLIDLELRQSLGHTSAPRSNPAFPIGKDTGLKGAFFEVVTDGVTLTVPGFKQSLAQRAGRPVQDE